MLAAPEVDGSFTVGLCDIHEPLSAVSEEQLQQWRRGWVCDDCEVPSFCTCEHGPDKRDLRAPTSKAQSPTPFLASQALQSASCTLKLVKLEVRLRWGSHPRGDKLTHSFETMTEESTFLCRSHPLGPNRTLTTASTGTRTARARSCSTASRASATRTACASGPPKPELAGSLQQPDHVLVADQQRSLRVST